VVAELSGWGVVGIVALACCLFVGLVVLGIAMAFKLDRHDHVAVMPQRVSVPPPAPAVGPAATRALAAARVRPTAMAVQRWIRQWLSVAHIVSPESSEGEWKLTDAWLARRRLIYRIAIGLAFLTAVGVIAAGFASISHPLLYRQHAGLLFGSYLTLLGLSLVLIVISTIPWHFKSQHAWQADFEDYWLSRHPGRYFGMIGLFALALGTVIVVGLANGIGGAVGYVQIGRRYFETYPGTSDTRITEATYLSSVRALGITESFFFLAGCLVCVLVGSSLRRVGGSRR